MCIEIGESVPGRIESRLRLSTIEGSRRVGAGNALKVERRRVELRPRKPNFYNPGTETKARYRTSRRREKRKRRLCSPVPGR